MIIAALIVIVVLAMVLFLFFKIIDVLYLNTFKRPLFVHFYLKKRTLKPNRKLILVQQFSFYKKLSRKHRSYFEHRVACFIDDKEFIGRDGSFVDDEKKVLIAATAVMLTFGMRNYLLDVVEKIIIYPDVFYSTINKANHKGEFNPMVKALVFSWKDFKEGYAIEDDNLNLGIHEFTHAIHLNSLKSGDTASIIFSDGFKELQEILKLRNVRDKMIESDYFRDYAFTNQFEFLAVVVENFIESPKDFKVYFPEIYYKLRQMFNFRFAGY
ncbi:MAG: zinc-dependent peptidase [Flavobacteriaceae bacterium]|nr:zinc-dependent peptidase [Flavobacteriaceae bacterium]